MAREPRLLLGRQSAGGLRGQDTQLFSSKKFAEAFVLLFRYSFSKQFPSPDLLQFRKLGELTLFSLEKRQLQDNLTAACECLQRDYQKDGGRFSMTSSHRCTQTRARILRMLSYKSRRDLAASMRTDKHYLFVQAKNGWRLNHFPGQPVPMLDNPLGEVKFPNIQSKPPLAQLEAISSCPITCYLGEETDPHLSTTSFQAKQPLFPQPLLIRLVLQTLHQLHCPSLDLIQHLNVPLVVGGPKLNTVFEVQPHQCRVQGHDHFPSPAGHAIFDTSQDAIGFLGCLGTLLAHIQAAVNKHPQVLLCQAAFQPLFPKPVALHEVAVAQVQDLALGLVKPHTIDLSPSIQPVQVPLQSLPTLQ
ncbi:hypothetical protein QYF61_010616 [Mycteria americana]|uniref:Uncharacterized protein n=1 Tax=Mycteria americana TaxID=33587 RepID=A0AAN7NFS3_MYCAM|nr:hypothetical protein QYF61_010616 [Mycteria americana]